MAGSTKKKFQVRDAAGVDHIVEAASAVEDEQSGKVRFYADAAQTDQVAGYTNPVSWGPAQSTDTGGSSS